MDKVGRAGRYPGLLVYEVIKGDAFAKTHKMAKQKFRPTRLGVFSGAKAYIIVCRGPEKTP
jgi:hypothetical protein